MVKGFLHIVTTPVSGDIYIDAEYRGTLDLNIMLDIGIYTVSFGDVVGYTTPSPLTVEVISDHTTIITVEYTKI